MRVTVPGADHDGNAVTRPRVQATNAGTHHEAGPWSASRSRPPEGAGGKGGSARQTHVKAKYIPWNELGKAFPEIMGVHFVHFAEIQSD